MTDKTDPVAQMRKQNPNTLAAGHGPSEIWITHHQTHHGVYLRSASDEPWDEDYINDAPPITTYASNERYVRGDLCNALPLPAPAQEEPVDMIGARSVAEAVEMGEGVGVWRSCSGCHETDEGYPSGRYSPALKCYLGLGCHECGGIGAVWDTTDYAEMGDWLAKELVADVDRHPAPASDDIEALIRRAENAEAMVRVAHNAGYHQAECGLPEHGDRHAAAKAALAARDKRVLEEIIALLSQPAQPEVKP